MAFIKLFSSFIQFYSTSIKSYYNNDIKIDKNVDKDIEDILLEIYHIFNHQDILPILVFLDVPTALVHSTLLETLTSFLTQPLPLLVLVKYRRGKP